jgi:hypothetical protein
VECPFIKRTYAFNNAESNIENAHSPDEVHDYGYSKRIPVYKFLAKHHGKPFLTRMEQLMKAKAILKMHSPCSLLPVRILILQTL